MLVNINERIREIRRLHAPDNPHDLARLVLDSLTGEDLRPVLADLLPERCRGVMNQSRLTASSNQANRSVVVEPEFWVDDNEDPNLVPAQRALPPRVLSWKHEVHAEHRRNALLQESFHVPGVGWIGYSKATVKDLIGAAEQRESNATSSLVEAQKFRQLAKALQDSGAETVGDLDDEVIEASQIV